MVAVASFLPLLASFSHSHFGKKPSPQTTGCDVSKASLSAELPASQTVLVAPSTSPDFIGLGVGVQNYTCASTGTYTNVGAVAELIDISCLYNTAEFASIATNAYTAWTDLPSEFTTQDLISILDGQDIVLGQHYFIVNPVTGTGTSPKWDFTSAHFDGDAEAFVVGAKTGDLPSPNGATDVDWLQLKNVAGEGDLATSIFRVETVGGTAPASCTFGSSPDLSIKYTAQYWLYGTAL